MRYYPIILLAIILKSIHAQPWHSDFESHQIGFPCTRGTLQNDGFTTNDWDNGLSSRSVIDTTYKVSGKKSLKIQFPKGQFGTSNDSGTGIQVELFIEPRNEYFMSYFIRFSDEFSWGWTNEGGKLPGLTNRKRCDADYKCDGTDGFSARFMWRKNGKGVLYLYYADMPQQYGQDFAFKAPDGSDFYFQRGKWYHIAEYVKNNTSSIDKNGIVQIWINGNEVLYLDTIRFQTNGDQIDNFFLSTFHGGNSADWAPVETSFIWIDDLVISPSLPDVSYRSCSNPDSEYFGEKCTTKDSTNLRYSIHTMNRFTNDDLTEKKGDRDIGKVFNLQGVYLFDRSPSKVAELKRGIYIFRYEKMKKVELHIKTH